MKKNLKSFSKSLGTLDAEKLLKNQLKGVKGGTLEVPCWSCKTGCQTNCIQGQVAKEK